MVKRLRTILSEETGTENPTSDTCNLAATSGSNRLRDPHPDLAQVETLCCGDLTIKKEQCDSEILIKKEVKEEPIEELGFGELGGDAIVESSILEQQLLKPKKSDVDACSEASTDRFDPPKRLRHERKTGNSNSDLNQSRHPRGNSATKGNLVCQECGFQSRYFKVLADHSNKHHGRKLFVCDVCGYGTDGRVLFRRHMMKHTGEKPYPCKICGKRYSRLSELMGRHMKVHSDDRLHACERCDYRGKRKEHLRGHMLRVHSAERRHGCDLCSYKGAQSQDLKWHVRTAHKINGALYSCDQCDYEGWQLYLLKRHKRTHLGRGDYNCYACEFKTHRRAGIIEHLRRHAGEKPYSCKDCNYRAPSAKDVNRHKKTHQRKRRSK